MQGDPPPPPFPHLLAVRPGHTPLLIHCVLPRHVSIRVGFCRLMLGSRLTLESALSCIASTALPRVFPGPHNPGPPPMHPRSIDSPL